MGDGSEYPSPRSEGPSGPTSILVTAYEPVSSSPKMTEADQISPEFVEGTRPKLSVRRAHDPPKNNEGQIFCDHPECHEAPPIFRRPCEWK